MGGKGKGMRAKGKGSQLTFLSEASPFGLDKLVTYNFISN